MSLIEVLQIIKYKLFKIQITSGQFLRTSPLKAISPIKMTWFSHVALNKSAKVKYIIQLDIKCNQ